MALSEELKEDRVAMESFSADYGQARMKLVEAAKAQGGELQRVTHPARGPEGADLSMDIAITGGQWRHADGLFYGGAAPSWSRKVLTDILTGNLGGTARVAIVDFHTGLGPYGYAEPIIHRRSDDPGFVRTRSWIGAAATSLYGGGSVSAEIHGDGLSAIQTLLPKAAVDAVALECGVLPFDKVGTALRADNWLHTHGDRSASEAASIKKLICEAFYSESPVWRGMALGQGLAACRAALGGLSLPLD
jgi:hypothetical protein